MHLTEGGYKKWQDFQEKDEKKGKYKKINNENILKPLAKYPKTISKRYIEKIKKLEIR